MRDEIAAYVTQYVRDNKHSPTYQQVGDEFGMSKVGARYHILRIKELKRYYQRAFANNGKNT